jgi:hypothetical protein
MKITAPPYLSDIERARENMRRTFMLPMPKNMFMKRLPSAMRIGTLDAPAIALAISVLPVPGGPSNRIPCGG